LLNREFARAKSAGRVQIENATVKSKGDKKEQNSPLRKSSLKTSAVVLQAEARHVQNEESEIVASLKRQLKE
jgi:predicted protein tyrosine phosphatase